MPIPKTDRLTRWRLLLGGEEADGTGQELEGQLAQMDQALSLLYDSEPGDRKGGLGQSNPQVNRWLGDIRKYFPASVVQILQQDALDRLGLQEMLLEPEMLSQLEPDVHLAATLIGLKNVIPDRTRETARQVVAKIVAQLEKRLRLPMIQAVKGAINRASRKMNPRLRDIDWHRTIRLNLKHYQKEYNSIIPARLAGFGRKGGYQKEVILLVDQSGSMASSLVYAGVLGAVLATMRSLKTHMVVFDTEVVDLTDRLHDPVELLFGVQLGGGTDINRALAYAEKLIRKPKDTILVLISDLFEGGKRHDMLRRVSNLKASGVSFISLLALSDEGKPAFDSMIANQFSQWNIPVFGATPDQFPRIMAAAIMGQRIPQS
jgi:Mg-chelatase subunit ChlD